MISQPGNQKNNFVFRVANIEVLFSLLSVGRDQMEIKKLCDSLGIRLISYSALGFGMLTGKYNLSNLLEGFRKMNLTFFQLLKAVRA